ncbi:hypothetical protein FQN54_000586 [Arachnomyces sp. PD_36]|nr:hypothetical protein FQN54_000586 [Arachnomyces sp. PD_36]
MSAPTKKLGKLSIGASRSQNREGMEPRDPQQEYTSDSSDEDSSSDEGAGSGSPSSMRSVIVQGSSTISYDLRKLSSDVRAQAIAGLKGSFDVEKCREKRGGYAFQLVDRGKVHIAEDSASCTCSDYEEDDNMACRHIFWLVDQLHRGLLPQRPPQGVLLADSGFCPSFPRIHELLDDELEALATKAEWPYVPGGESASGSSTDSGAGMSRQQKARDILSAFNEKVLPEEFRQDLYETGGLFRTPEQCVVQGDFEATMFRLAVHDDDVYSSLRKVMPAGACAVILFDKLQKKFRRLLADFDEYCESGKPQPDGSRLEVSVVVKKLTHIVDQIESNIVARAPHGAKGAAESLVGLLTELCRRNFDAMEDSSWGRQVPAGEDEDDRNLYEQLIGQTDDTGGFFILDALEYIPASVILEWRPRLMAALEKLERNRAPAPYIRKLQSLIAESTASSAATSTAAAGASASGHKRPATGTPEGKSKRTR